MEGESLTRAINRRIGAVADRQQGVVARWQLVAAGDSDGAIEWRVATGFLRPLHQGVYLVGHAVQARFAREMAGALAVGPGGVVVSRSAANMYEILPYPARGDVWVTDASGHSGRRPGLHVQRMRSLLPDEVQLLDGVPVTSPARTLFDVAAVGEYERLEGAVSRALRVRLVTRERLLRQLERARGRRGVRPMRRILDAEADPRRIESEAELRMLALIRRAGLPEPEMNVYVGGFLVDFYWPERRVVAEFDGYAFHSDPLAFRRDRERSNALQLMGILVLRFTWHDLTRAPDALESRLREALFRDE